MVTYGSAKDRRLQWLFASATVVKISYSLQATCGMVIVMGKRLLLDLTPNTSGHVPKGESWNIWSNAHPYIPQASFPR